MRTLFTLAILLTTLTAFAQDISHTTSKGNIVNHYTIIDAKGLNDNPSAIIIVQPGKEDSEHPMGVWYTGKNWSIFHEDMAPLASGIDFTITTCQASNSCFVHTVKEQAYESYIDNTLLNNNPNAKISFTQNWNPGGKGSVYNNAFINMHYNLKLDKWYVSNNNKTMLAKGAAINIMIQPANHIDLPVSEIPISASDVIYTAPLINDVDFDNWDFEKGIQGWSFEGAAFETQPVFGDNVDASRVRYDFTLEGGGLGGDYWRDTPYPIGHKGNYWIGTFENQPEPYTQLENGVYMDEKRGNTQGDAPTGIMTSPEFKVTKLWCDFLIGGGSDRNAVSVELQIKQPDNNWQTVLSRIPIRNSELMQRTEFAMSEFTGKTARIQIIDNSSGGWGHINVDDFRFLDALPQGIRLMHNGVSYRVDEDFPVWGVADTHEHPQLDEAHGGNVVEGKLSGPADAITLPDNGYPDFQSRPAFDRGDYTKMHQDWIKRAHEGGVRLICGLAVNNWMAASAFVKNLAKPSEGVASIGEDPVTSFSAMGGAWDDRAISQAEINAMRAWARLPETQTWLGIATTPAEARKLILENKVALVLGIEVDMLGNFVETDMGYTGSRLLPDDMAARRAMIGEYLDNLKRFGVTQITPIHYVSEPWGGAAIFNRWFNEQNRLFTGRNIVMEEGGDYGIRYRINNDQWGAWDSSLREIITGHNRTIAWDGSWDATPLGHLNSVGLLPTGEILLEELAKRGMIIDVDHTSFKTEKGFFQFARTKLNNYPIISSHTDMGQLSFTGDGEWQRDNYRNFDRENVDRFGTSLIGNVRHEGQATDEKLSGIKASGGTLGIIMLPYRKMDYLNNAYVFNNNDGSTKTWAQMYLYGINFMDGKNVGFCMDQGFVKSLGPRFGLNAAHNLSMENTDDLKKTKRLEQVSAQSFGVTYDVGVRYRSGDGTRFRLPDESQNFAFDGTGKEDMYADGWIALNAYKAGHNPWTEGESQLPTSGYPTHAGRIKNYARGFNLSRDEFRKIQDECGAINCLGAGKHERIAAYCVANGLTPNDIPEYRNDAWVIDNYNVLKALWDHWEKMEGANSGNVVFPLKRSVTGNREWDYNMDGLAHYGLMVDFLQDFYNVMKERLGAESEKPAALISPLFRSAEDYLRMWERAVTISKELRGKM